MEPREPDPASVLEQSGWLRRLARSLVRDPHRADDAVQETLLAALEQPAAARTSPRGWLGAVLRNAVRQEERARGRRERRESSAGSRGDAPSAADTSARIELQARVLEAVRALEEPYRTAIVQRYLDGLPPRAIARGLGVPVKTVHTRIERGLAKLRARLDGNFGGREAWLAALLPFAGPGFAPPWGTLRKGVVMGTKTKVAAAVACVAVAGWFARGVLEEPRRAREPGNEASPPARPETTTPAGGSETPGELLAAPPLPATADAIVDARSVATPRAATAPALEPASAVLDVRVVKETSGEPVVAVVEVRAFDVGGPASLALWSEPLRTQGTSTDGVARIEVAPGRRLSITAAPRERHPLDPVRRATLQIEPLAADEHRALVFELVHGLDRVFYGQVVAAEDGRALPGARVVRRPVDEDAPRTTADAGGYFELPYASWEKTEVEVRLDGFGPRLLELERLDQTLAEPYVVALERAASIDARITLADGIEHAELWAATRGGPRWAQALDANGRGILEGLRAGVPLTVELRAGEELLWRDEERWTLELGERRALVLDLSQGTLVHGRLHLASGAPIADQEVWAIPASGVDDETPLDERRHMLDPDERGSARIAVPDPRGRYELAHVPAGRWWIGPAPRTGIEGAVAALARMIELGPRDTSRVVDLEAVRGLWIHGRVLDAGGAPRGNLFVRATHADAGGQVGAQADRDGAFALGPLAPGTYQLRAFGDGVFGWGEPLAVEAGTDGVELRLGGRNAITGRVVDVEGRPEDSRVHLLQRSGSLGQGTSQREQGAFAFIDLEPGTYTVQAETNDGRIALQQVELADGARVAGVVLTLQPGARIGVSHSLDHNVRCSIWSDGVLASDSTVRAGEEALEVVPAGKIRVELYSGETLAERTLEARAGRVETVRFEL